MTNTPELPISVKHGADISSIDDDLRRNGRVSAAVLFHNLIVAAENSNDLGERVNAIFRKYSTIGLRDCLIEFGSYWSDLEFANKVDAIDSAFAHL